MKKYTLFGMLCLCVSMIGQIHAGGFSNRYGANGIIQNIPVFFKRHYDPYKAADKAARNARITMQKQRVSNKATERASAKAAHNTKTMVQQKQTVATTTRATNTTQQPKTAPKTLLDIKRERLEREKEKIQDQLDRIELQALESTQAPAPAA